MESNAKRLQFNEELKIPVSWGFLVGKLINSSLYLALCFESDINCINYIAKVWGPEDGLPILALHGWQDNAGSFDTIAPLLPLNTRLVCLEFCGNRPTLIC